MSSPVAFLRILLWALAAALVLNAVIATAVYGDGGLLGIGGFLLAAALVLTDPKRGLLRGMWRR